MVGSYSDWRQFSIAVNAARRTAKPVRHLGKDVPISKVSQLSFPAGKKCNRSVYASLPTAFLRVGSLRDASLRVAFFA